MLEVDICVIFNLGSAKVKHFSYDKDIWMAVADYYMNFYLNRLFPSVAILQFINFTAT